MSTSHAVFRQSPNMLPIPLQNSSRPMLVRHVPGQCWLDMSQACEVCISWSKEMWRKLRRSLHNSRAKADKKMIRHWSTVFSWLETAGLHQLGSGFQKPVLSENLYMRVTLITICREQ